MISTRRRLCASVARVGVSALVGAGLVMGGPATVAAASDTHLETVVVRADGAVVTTSTTLRPGTRYQLEVEGTYRASGRTADAECSSAFAPVWVREEGGFDLLVDGHDVDWQPVHQDVLRCNSRDHRYTLSFTVPAAHRLVLAIDLPDGKAGVGDLTVSLLGPAGSGSDGTAPSGPQQPQPPTPAESPDPPRSERPPSERPPSEATSPEVPVPEPQASNPQEPAADAESYPSAEPSPDDQVDGPTPSRGQRELTSEEMFRVLVPGATGDPTDPHPPVREIELAVRPDDAMPGSSLQLWVTLGGLVVLAQLLLLSRSNGRVLAIVGGEARSVYELVARGGRRRAVAHRITSVEDPVEGGRRVKGSSARPSAHSHR